MYIDPDIEWASDGCEMKILVDSGATMSVIDKSIYTVIYHMAKTNFATSKVTINYMNLR